MPTTMIIRNIPEEDHKYVKITAAASGIPMNTLMLSMINLAGTIGSPREAALDNVEFRLVPHRTDDGQDTPEVWRWKLQAMVDGKLTESTIL